MIAAAPGFPTVPTPEGWTRSQHGPRVWLVPPTPGGRIVIPPLQARPKQLPPTMFLDRVLVQERDRFPRLTQTEPVTVTSNAHVPGLVVDVAGLDASDRPLEWRCYALFATQERFALLFLQVAPQRHAELRPVFLALAASVDIPEDGPPGVDTSLPLELL